MIKLIFTCLFFSGSIFAQPPTFRVDADETRVEWHVDSNSGGKFDGSYSKDDEGGYKLSFSSIITDSQKPNWSINSIPLIYENKTYGGLTETSEYSGILVGALHLFRFDQSKLALQIKQALSNYVPILVRKSDHDFFDVVIFVDKKRFSNLTADDETESLLQSELGASKLKSVLQNELGAFELYKDGTAWISPHQFGLQKKSSTSQYSEGVIRKAEQNTLLGKQFSFFYLADTEFNYSSKGSSGSVIFNSDTAKPIGVIQCQISKNYVVDGIVQNTKGLYQVLSFDVLKEFKIEPLESLDKLFQYGSLLKTDADCDWRDGKLGGGN
jgi:hypothetical protein